LALLTVVPYQARVGEGMVKVLLPLVVRSRAEYAKLLTRRLVIMNKRQKGFSLIELLIVVAIILIIAAIAIPNLLRSKMAANEASAVGSMRTLNTAAVTYSTTYGGYPASLATLGPAATATSTTADLVDSVLASGTKSGYTFTYVAGGADTNGNILSYSITASPVTTGTTGQRSFYTDQSGVIRADANTTATSSSTPIS
jgi:prepilin-type N-terminal cleavage/methylation domain-containing protein